MKRLKAWFDTTEVKQGEFGKWVGVSQPTVSDWVTGRTNPAMDKLPLISQRTGIPIELLVADCTESKSVEQTAA